MLVSLDLVEAISRAVAAEENMGVERVTVASTSAEAHRVELLVTLVRHPFERCRVLLNLSREEPVAFEQQLRAKLHEMRSPLPRALGLVSRPRLD